jgi:hypothetical protein
METNATALDLDCKIDHTKTMLDIWANSLGAEKTPNCLPGIPIKPLNGTKYPASLRYSPRGLNPNRIPRKEHNTRNNPHLYNRSIVSLQLRSSVVRVTMKHIIIRNSGVTLFRWSKSPSIPIAVIKRNTEARMRLMDLVSWPWEIVRIGRFLRNARKRFTPLNRNKKIRSSRAAIVSYRM